VRSRSARWTLYLGLIVLYLLHNDVWLWGNPTIVLGLPVGLLYHAVYCLVVAALMAMLVRFAWPFSRRREP
jgi:hypothetical protein